jgi:hypothetical protein
MMTVAAIPTIGIRFLPGPFPEADFFCRRSSVNPLLWTTSARSSNPLPVPTAAERVLFSKSVLGPLAAPATALWAVRLAAAGTVWIVPQNWHRQTPPAKASSIRIAFLQLVQVI